MASSNLKMLVIVLTAMSAGLQQTAAIINAVLEPYDVAVCRNGTDLDITCHLGSDQPDGLTAADVVWRACVSLTNCRDAADEHSVVTVGNATSILQLRNLAMPSSSLDEGVTYLCKFPDDPDWSLEYGPQAYIVIYVGRQPGPVEDLHCFTRNVEEFTCTWNIGRYTGLAMSNVTFEYRMSVDAPWRVEVLDKTVTQFTGLADAFKMEIRITQFNHLGSGPPRIIYFWAAEETIPDPPERLTVNIDLVGEDTGSVRVGWSSPSSWTSDESLLVYKIRYNASEEFTIELHGGETSLLLKNLRPYTNYTLAAKCRLYGARKWSEWTAPLTILSPEAAPSGTVLNLRQNMINPDRYQRDVCLNWQPPSDDKRHGLIRGYQLSVSPDYQPVDVHDLTYVLRGLNKFESYEVLLRAYTLEGFIGPVTSLDIDDLTAEPVLVENVNAVEVTAYSILVGWQKPSNPTGVITSYTVEWINVKAPENVYVRAGVLATRYLIGGLLPYVEYQVNISNFNKVGKSRPVSQNVRTLPAEPSRPLKLVSGKHSPTEIKLSWAEPEALNGPFVAYEVRYRPSDYPANRSISQSTSVAHVTLKLNCTAFDDNAEPFTFEVLAVTGSEEEALVGPPAVMESHMCGAGYSITSIIIGILISAFSIVSLLFCLYTVCHSPLLKPPPDPYFIDGILEPSNDKFKFNSRLAARRPEKEYYDVLKTCEAPPLGHELEIVSNKGSMSSSTGCSSDQGFHEMMPPDIDVGFDATTNRNAITAAAVSYARSSSGYGQSLQSQSDQDLRMKQHMLSIEDDDEDAVFEDGLADGEGGHFVNSYRACKRSDGSQIDLPPRRLSERSGSESVQYTTSRQDTPPATNPGVRAEQRPSTSSYSGSESESMNYLQLGAVFPPAPQHPGKDVPSDRPLKRSDPGEESDTSYAQMAMQTLPQPHPEYQSVWPTSSDLSPDDDIVAIDLDQPWVLADLGFNNNSKEIVNVHASPFGPDVITAPASFSSAERIPDDEPFVPLRHPPSLERENVSPGADTPLKHAAPSQFPSAVTASGNRRDFTCQDYVLQSELPPASPQESTIL